MLSAPGSRARTAILLGFESSGKSALFRGLTGQATGEESNVRGSTITMRKGQWAAGWQLMDLPGIRSKDDSRTTSEAVSAIDTADVVLLVVRATHAASELPLLLQDLNLQKKRAALIFTFADKILLSTVELVDYYRNKLGIPVYAVDARQLQAQESAELLQQAAQAGLLQAESLQLQSGGAASVKFPDVHPQATLFEHRIWGRQLAAVAALLIFALPVFLAYQFSVWLQPLLDEHIITPVKALLDHAPALLQALIAGDYGVITLGLYSFLWAFPVVLLLGFSLALAEESGIKDRITDALDGWMRRIGLNGRDLIPVLSGFGCNVVAVFQSRACSACTRKSCISLITFGSACSYQIGASLSIFGSAGHPWLFLPYILTLALVGALHTRLWNRRSPLPQAPLYQSKTFLQLPDARAVSWRLRSVIKQFLMQAMPIFIVICLVAALLQFTGWMNWLARALQPLLQLLHLPAEAAGGIVFSVLRKDGLLILNQNEGALLKSLHAGQLFVLVYIASTLTACLVTLWTVRKELGWSFALGLAGKQAATSLASAIIIMLLVGG